MVFRTVFSGIAPLALPREEADRTVGTTGVEAGCCGVGRAEGRRGDEGERNLVGFNVEVGSPEILVTTGRLFLGLLDGKGGRAVFGGSIGGRDKTGSDVATVADMVVDSGSDLNLSCYRSCKSSNTGQTSFLNRSLKDLLHELYRQAMQMKSVMWR